MKNALLPNRLRYWLLPILALVLLINYVSQARLRPDNPTVRPGLKSAPERPKETAPKSKVRRTRSKQTPASNDPIRFTLQADKRQVAVGEEIELTITAQLMGLSPNLMFFLPGSNAYTLKLLTPAGFQATGGDFAEYVTEELTYPAKTQATYHLRGHFTAPTEGLSFRLLRSHGQANSQSLYEEKARLQITVQAQSDGAARLSDPCAGISLSAQASSTIVSVGGSVTLSAACTGCSGGGGSTLYSTNFDGQAPNTDFQSSYTDQISVVSNAQEGDNSAYCSLTDHTGNSGGKMLRFRGEDAGSVWIKERSVTNGTTYTFSVWAKPVFQGNPASGATQQTLKLKVKVNDIDYEMASQSIGASNPSCTGGWVQLSGSWTATTTGSVPFSIQVPNATSWQHAFVLDDIQISSGGGGSGASYEWRSLPGNNIIASGASTQVTPTQAGTYQYRVTLTSGSCTTQQDVTVTVASTTARIRTRPNFDCCLSRYMGGTFEGSDDQTNWTLLGTITAPPQQNAWVDYPLNTPTVWRYLRYVSSANAYGDLVELQFWRDGQKLTGVPFGSTGVHINESKYHYSSAFDSDSTTIWATRVNGTQNYAGLDTKSTADVFKACILTRSNFDCCMSRYLGGSFQSSPDSTTWTTLYTISPTSLPAQDTWTEYSLSPPANWRYIRFLASAENFSYGDLMELEFRKNGVKLMGVPFGSASAHLNQPQNYSYAKAFDGNPTTLWSGQTYATQNFAGLDTKPCNFTPTAVVSNTNPACSSTVSLSATCSGTDCSGVAYAWTGPNGFTSNSQTVNATVPNTTGNYSYTVTASKSGCIKTATVAINTTCNTSTPRFYVGRAVPGVFDPELYQDATGDWWIREKATNYTDNRPRHYNINRAHVPDGSGGLLSANGYKLGNRGGRYIVEMTRWQGPDSWRKIDIEAFRMEFILPGSMNEPDAIETPTSFVPSENYIDNSVAMVPAHDTLKGKITVKVKYNEVHQDSQLKALGATHFGKNTSETNLNKMQVINGEPWDGGSTAIDRTTFRGLSDGYIQAAAQQGIPALYFTDFETQARDWSVVSLNWDGDNDATLRKFYTYHEALINKNPGRLVTDYYRNIVNNKGFPDPGNGQPNPLHRKYVRQYSNPDTAVTEAYRGFIRENGTPASLRNLYNVWLLDDYGRETFEPNNQYELYRSYSMIHDSRIMRKVVGNSKRIISYAWPGADYDIGYTLKREIPGKGWVSHYARRYKSAAAVEMETYLAYLVTDGYSPFHDQASSTNNPELACPWGDMSDYWETSNHSPTPISTTMRDHCYPREPQYYNEHVNLAEYKLSKVNTILDGGYAQDAPFNLTGSTTSFLNEEGETAILHRAANKQHIVLKKVKVIPNGKDEAFVMAVNPFANESDKSTLTVKLADDWIVTITTSGKWPTLKRFTHP
ncbi:discoidin domain-containing protein [Spirosoma areae]